MKKTIAIIVTVALICFLSILLFVLAARIKFLESFSSAQHYKTKDEFVNRYGPPVYELTNMSEMQASGPIQDEEFLKDKTLCLFGYKFPYRFIIVYFDAQTNEKIYITWEDM